MAALRSEDKTQTEASKALLQPGQNLPFLQPPFLLLHQANATPAPGASALAIRSLCVESLPPSFQAGSHHSHALSNIALRSM